MTYKSGVPADYRGRDKMSLVEFIEDVESTMFRTRHDIGGNLNALIVWNTLREYAGLESLTELDLDKRHAVTDNLDLGELTRKLDRYDRYCREERMRNR